jgi:hypothetical protein
MANVLYPAFKESLLNKELDLDSDVIKLTLIDSGSYTFASTDTTYTQGTDGVPDAAKIASVTLASVTIAGGVVDSDDPTFTAVIGPQSEALIIFDNTHAQKRLIAFYDTGITGMPITPNGGDINVVVNASGWFAL